MGSTILHIAQDAAGDLGLNASFSTLFPADDNGDTSDIKLRRALTRTVQYLAATYDWQVLESGDHTFTTIAAETQTNAIPSDFLRFIPETMWDRTSKWRVSGPTSAKEWQELKSWVQSTTVPYFRQVGNALLFYPAPAAGRTIAFEYIRNIVGHVSSTDATTIARFAADTNVTLWDDELITQGIVWQYRKGERFDYAQDQADFMQLMTDRIKQDGGRKKINMGGRQNNTAQGRIDAMRSAAVVIKT